MQKSSKSVFQYRVYYEDTDLGGVVYYANYLKFFERARTDYLREKNIVQTKLADETGIIFVVRNCQVEFIKPARMDDLIEVSVVVKEIGKLAITMHQEIRVEGQLLCKMNVEIVSINQTNFRPSRIPASVAELI